MKCPISLSIVEKLIFIWYVISSQACDGALCSVYSVSALLQIGFVISFSLVGDSDLFLDKFVQIYKEKALPFVPLQQNSVYVCADSYSILFVWSTIMLCWKWICFFAISPVNANGTMPLTLDAILMYGVTTFSIVEQWLFACFLGAGCQQRLSYVHTYHKYSQSLCGSLPNPSIGGWLRVVIWEWDIQNLVEINWINLLYRWSASLGL